VGRSVYVDWQKLDQARKAERLTWEELAQKADLELKVVRKPSQGKPIDKSSLTKIAQAVNINDPGSLIAGPPATLADYRARLADLLPELPLRGLPDAGSPAPRLDKLFVNPWVEEFPLQRDSPRKKPAKRRATKVLGTGCDRLVFLGGPGSGKSSLLRWAGLAALKNAVPVLVGARFGPSARTRRLAALKNAVPVLVEIRHLDRALPHPQALDLWRYFLSLCGHLNMPSGFFDDHAKHGRLLVLFDGLDEVPSAPRQDEIVTLVRQFAKDLPKGNKVIVGSRRAGYLPERLPEFRHWLLQDFEETEIRTFLHHWYGDERTAGKAWRALEGSAIRADAGNPLVLTMLARIHRPGHPLPAGRAQVYYECAKSLVYLWPASKEFEPKVKALKRLSYLDKFRMLGQIAYQAQLQAGK
jgi:predicted NACHT family NTPase